MTWFAALAVVCCAACAPTLDWREFTPDGSAISVTFPCRPDRHGRVVTIAGEKAQMEMLVCTVAETTFAVSFFDVAGPTGVSGALRELREAATRNVQGSVALTASWQIKGMTPNDDSLRVRIDGKLPDGTAVQEQAVFFSKGLRVYQAAVIAPKLLPQAIDPFFDGLKFPS